MNPHFNHQRYMAQLMEQRAVLNIMEERDPDTSLWAKRAITKLYNDLATMPLLPGVYERGE